MTKSEPGGNSVNDPDDQRRAPADSPLRLPREVHPGFGNTRQDDRAEEQSEEEHGDAGAEEPDLAHHLFHADATSACFGTGERPVEHHDAKQQDGGEEDAELV